MKYLITRTLLVVKETKTIFTCSIRASAAKRIKYAPICTIKFPFIHACCHGLGSWGKVSN